MASKAMIPIQTTINLDILKIDPIELGKKLYDILPKRQRDANESFNLSKMKLDPRHANVTIETIRDAFHRALGDTAKSRILLEDLLEAHTPHSGAHEQYIQLGSKLPDKDLLKLTKRTLSPIFHEDKMAGNHDLIKQSGDVLAQLNQAIKHLQTPEKSAVYNKIIPQIEKVSGGKEKISTIFNEARGKPPIVSATTEGALARVVRGFKGASPVAKSAIVVGAVAGIGTAVYGISKIIKDKTTNQDPEGFVAKEKARTLSQNALHIS